jgi:hypothetical protein
LAAKFPSPQSAILAARRLQWSVQGFSEARGDGTTSIGVLIHLPEDIAGKVGADDLPDLLKKLAPDRILLTVRASQPIENLPGFLLQAFTDGLRELTWRGPESQSTRSFDEQTLAGILERLGVQDQPQSELAPPAAALGTNARTGKSEALPAESTGGKPRWIMVAVGLAAVILVTVTIVFLSHGKPHQATAESQAPVQSVSGAATAPNASVAQGGQSPPASSPEANRTVTQALAKPAKDSSRNEARSAQVSKPEKQLAPKAPEPGPKGRCDLESSQYSGQIDLAWKNLGRGKYADAQREFSAVLACDPNNGRAREGLERAKLAARQAQAQPGN